MKTIVVLAAWVLSQSAFAQAPLDYWNCTVKCAGASNKILGSLPPSASTAETSDFKAECTQVLGGYVGTTSPTYCGAYYYCFQSESSSYSTSGSGDGLIAARQDARNACQNGNFSNHDGSGCPYDYRNYLVDEGSFQCSQ